MHKSTSGILLYSNHFNKENSIYIFDGEAQNVV